jgi:hypothetical protein
LGGFETRSYKVHWGICAMNPMPSGAAAHRGHKRLDAATVGAGGGAELTDVGGVAAVGEAGAARAGEAFGRARTGAEAAMHPAAAVRHGRLAAGAAAAGAGAAPGRGQEITGAIAVLQAAAPVGREGGGDGGLRRRRVKPMPSGGGATGQVLE